MRRSLTALTLASLLLPLGGCDMIRGLFGLGFIVSGQVTFSSSARTTSGDLYIRLLSTVEANHTGTVLQERKSVYFWGDQQESFSFTGVQEGPCHVLAFIDTNANQAWDPGEPVGGYPTGAGSVPALTDVAGDREFTFTVWMNGAPVAGIPVSIVYNPLNPADTAVAQSIRTLLMTNLPETVPGVSGSMPLFTVTLVPEGSIPATYDAFYIMPGGADPVILTPGITMQGNDQWCHNIADQGRGVIAMGVGGSHFLETTTAWYPGWGYPDQKPEAIDWSSSWTWSADTVVVQNATMAWAGPVVSAAIPTTDAVSVALASSAIQTVEAHSPGGAPPVLGEWHAARVGDPEHFTVGRQGRYILFGFDGVPDRADTAHVFLANLVKLLSDMY